MIKNECKNGWYYKEFIINGHKELFATRRCDSCGKEYSRTHIGTTQYCEECSKEIKRIKTAERVRKHRALKKADHKK